MKQTQLIMGMPITIEIVDGIVSENDVKSAFEYLNMLIICFRLIKIIVKYP